ncbi:MAG: 50S ribosomal protein L18 [Candidatus Diapherotrites archaeon]
MSKTSTFETKFRRRREQKTDYSKRLALLKTERPRMVVRLSNQYVRCQIVHFKPEGDEALASVYSKQLKKIGWNGSGKNLPACYLTGFWMGREALQKGISEAILDMGMKTPVHGGRVFAVLKGAVDAGLKIPHDEKAFPPLERIQGKHIESFAKALGEGKGNRFSKSESSIPEMMEKVKKALEQA